MFKFDLFSNIPPVGHLYFFYGLAFFLFGLFIVFKETKASDLKLAVHIATALFIFAVGIYELFIEDPSLPEWFVIRNLHDLKAKLGSVIILVMAVTFLKHLVEWRDPHGTFYFGIAVAVVSASLIAFSHFGGKD